VLKQAFLVDDSKSARIVLSRMLKKSGFDGVVMAESGEEALTCLKDLTPDAIFVDYLMDGMDGLETIAEIKKEARFETTPIVMCTANEGDEYVQAAVEHGALGILAKPPTEESLGEIIQLIERHQQEVADSKLSEAEDVASIPSEDVVAQAPTEVAVIAASLSDEDVQRIAQEVASQTARQVAEQAAKETTLQTIQEATEQVVSEVLDERLEAALGAYLDQKLEPLVLNLVRKEIAEVKPVEVDSSAIREDVVEHVNRNLEDFVRQLNQRTMEEQIQASVYGKIAEVTEDFSTRLKEQEERILNQVPEKNDMIEHIRVITEGSIEAQVHETATQVAHEIANSVATERVEQVLDQRLPEQDIEIKEQSGGGNIIWIVLGVLLLASAIGFYFLL
jgi:CheY-like chemotaxis protein